MSVKVMSMVFDSALDSNLKLVALAYADHADHEGGSVYPALASIAEKTSYSRRHVKRITRELEEMGVLISEGQSARGTNKWRFDLDKLPQNEGDKMTPQRESEGGTPGGGRGTPESPEPSTSYASVSKDTLALTRDEAQKKQGKTQPSLLVADEPEPAPPKKTATMRNEVTNSLTSVFLQATGLAVPGDISHAAFNKLWRTPLWEIFELCGKDLELASAAVRDTCAYMRNEKLTLSRPLSIINVARDRIAQGLHHKEAGDVEQGEAGGLWI